MFVKTLVISIRERKEKNPYPVASLCFVIISRESKRIHGRKETKVAPIAPPIGDALKVKSTKKRRMKEKKRSALRPSVPSSFPKLNDSSYAKFGETGKEETLQTTNLPPHPRFFPISNEPSYANSTRNRERNVKNSANYFLTQPPLTPFPTPMNHPMPNSEKQGKRRCLYAPSHEDPFAKVAFRSYRKKDVSGSDRRYGWLFCSV